jgi:Flp pilus assembly protein protease CpaA
MQIAKMLHRFQAFLFFHDEFYELTIKSATVILLCYIALIDLRTFKIENKSVVLLFVFYILYALGRPYRPRDHIRRICWRVGIRFLAMVLH